MHATCVPKAQTRRNRAIHHLIAKRTTRRAFEHLSTRNPGALLALCSRDLRHEFAGDHALGGVRSSRQGFEDWLLRLFPVLTFEPRAILVKGPPWNVALAVIWTDRGLAADGVEYRNHGVHELTVRWGRLVSLRAHLDTQHLSQVLERMAKDGIAEASAPPIEDRP